MSRKKSVEAHIENGTYRPSVHGPRPTAGVPLGGTAPKKPRGLSREASRTWDELMTALGKRASGEDAAQLEQAAIWLAKFRLIVAKLDTTEPGTVNFSRLISAASVASKNFDRVARKFGLTPLDRGALSVPAGGGNGAKVW